MLDKVMATVCGLNPCTAFTLLHDANKDTRNINAILGVVMVSGQAMTLGGIAIICLTTMLAKKVFKKTRSKIASAQSISHPIRDRNIKALKAIGVTFLGIMGTSFTVAGLYMAFITGSLVEISKIPTFRHKV